MSTFKVIEIIDADTIKVSPSWIFKERKGDIIKILGYRTPPENLQSIATTRLKTLILNKEVELKDAQFFNPDSAALFCRVYLNDNDLAKYFTDFGSTPSGRF